MQNKSKVVADAYNYEISALPPGILFFG